MNRSPIMLIALGALLPFILGGAFYFGAEVQKGVKEVEGVEGVEVVEANIVELKFEGEYIPHGYLLKDFFDEAYSRVGEVEKVNPKSAIVAHHLLVADKIAEVFESLGSDKIETVVLISPNHFSRGQMPAQTSAIGFTTPYGDLDPDEDAIHELVSTVSFLGDEKIGLRGEHGIGNITPYIKKSFPNARVVPIIVDEQLTKAQADELGAVIASALPNAVVIGSIDFSHNMPDAVADYHDDISIRYINSGGCAEVDCEIELEIDSNATMNTLLSFNREKGLGVWQQTHHSSSVDMGLAEDWRENTSHVLGYFEHGAPLGSNFVSLHFVGDIMLDRGVRVKIDQAGTVGYPWVEMERFLMGSHLTVGNLEGTVNEQASSYTYDPPFRFVFTPESVVEMGKYIDVVSLANNHTSDVGSAGQLETKERLSGMGIEWFGSYRGAEPTFTTEIYDQTIAMIGYHQFQPEEAELVLEIEAQKAAGRFVIVYPHWGPEYYTNPASSQTRLAKKMVEAGADLIVGGHPHVAQGVDSLTPSSSPFARGRVANVPVVYSLGNFVFDQLIPETWEAITVGIIIDEENVILHLMPVYTLHGQPRPLSALESEKVLNKIANASPEHFRSQILNQKIVIKRYE